MCEPNKDLSDPLVTIGVKRQRLEQGAAQVTGAMARWIDAVVDHRATGEPNEAELHRLGSVVASAFSAFAQDGLTIARPGGSGALTDDPFVAPHHYRVRVANRYRDVDVDAKRADELGRHALSIWLHGQAEAYAQSMVELVGDLAARQTWRTRASEHSQATEEGLRALRAGVVDTINAACSTELPQPVQL